MTQFVKKRPRAVSVIGWCCIVVGICEVASDIHSIWNIWNYMPEPVGATTSQQLSDLDKFNSKVVPLIAVIGVFLDGLQVIAGAYLLKLRAWARTTIEVVAWIQILVLAVGPILGFIYIACFTTGLTEWPGMLLSNFLFLALSCAWITTWYGLVIYFLRSKKVRAAFATPP